MSRPRPLHWLTDHTTTGIRELPSNTAWLLSRALQPAEAATGTRDKARKIRADVMDAVPMGDSVETG